MYVYIYSFLRSVLKFCLIIVLLQALSFIFHLYDSCLFLKIKIKNLIALNFLKFYLFCDCY